MQCIDSILGQTLKDIEVILVDEGDIDECRAIIDMYEFGPKKDARIRTLHEKNGGYGASCNKGFDMAQGEYISIIESDDFIEPTMYEEMYSYAKNLDADVVKTPYYNYKDGTKTTAASKEICCYADEMTQSCPKNKTFSVLDYPLLMGVHASLWSGIYKTSYMKEKNIRFVEAKGGAYVDVGFRIDTLINTNKVAWLDKPFYNYRLTSEGSTTNNYNLNAMLQRWQEVHEKFENTPEIYEKVGPESLYDEYLNTAGYLSTDYKVTEEHLAKMQKLFKYIPDNVINKTEKLSKNQQKLIFDIKYKKLKLNEMKKKWYSIHISFHMNRAKIHIFNGLEKNLTRIIFRIGGLYVLDFCIGRVK